MTEVTLKKTIHIMMGSTSWEMFPQKKTRHSNINGILQCRE